MTCCKCKCKCGEPDVTTVNKPLPCFVKTSERFWLNWGGVPEEFISLTDIAVGIDGIFRFKAMHVKSQQSRDLFPGDIGLPGFNKDGRPCVATRSYDTAIVVGRQYVAWLARHQSNDRYSV